MPMMRHDRTEEVAVWPNTAIVFSSTRLDTGRHSYTGRLPYAEGDDGSEGQQKRGNGPQNNVFVLMINIR